MKKYHEPVFLSMESFLANSGEGVQSPHRISHAHTSLLPNTSGNRCSLHAGYHCYEKTAPTAQLACLFVSLLQLCVNGQIHPRIGHIRLYVRP